MKKLTSIVLVLTLVLTLAACGGPKPEDTVKTFCAALQAFDLNAMQACVEEKFNEEEVNYDDLEQVGGLLDYMKKTASEISCDIGKGTVNGDSATVTAKMQYTDISPVVKEVVGEYFVMLFGLLGDEDMTEEDFTAAMETIVEEKASGVQTTRSEIDVTFDLKKSGDAWKITKLPDEVLTVLSGNMQKGVEDASEELAKMFEDAGWTSETQEPEEYPMDAVVLFDNEYAKMTVLGGGTDEWGDSSFQIECVNKTEDKELSFYLDYMLVNGWMSNSYLSEDVAAGDKITTTLSLYDSDLERLGIATPDKVSLKMHVYESEDWWSDEYLIDDYFTFYPTCLSDAEIVIPDLPNRTNTRVLADNDLFRFVIIGEEEESESEYYPCVLLVYLQNRTDEDIQVHWENVTINECGVESYFGMTVPAGIQTLNRIMFDSEQLDANSIEEVEEISFDLMVHADWDWDLEPLYSEYFSYEP